MLNTIIFPKTRVYSSGVVVTPPPSIPWHSAVWADDPSWTNPGAGGAVSSWRDFSGNSRTLTQATGSKQPIFRSPVADFNNKSCVDFDGVDDFLTSSAFTAVAQPFSSIWIGRRDGAGGGNGESVMYHAGPVIYMYIGGPYWTIYAGVGFTPGLAYNTNATAIRARFNSTASALTVGGTLAGGTNAGTATATTLALGGDGAVAGNYANVHVAFSGLYAGDITAHAEWTNFRNWVTSNYGLTLA